MNVSTLKPSKLRKTEQVTRELSCRHPELLTLYTVALRLPTQGNRSGEHPQLVSDYAELSEKLSYGAQN